MDEGCPGCGALGTITAQQVDEDFQYGAGPDAVMLTSHHCLFTCSACTMQYTSFDAEESRQLAVDEHLRSRRVQPE